MRDIVPDDVVGVRGKRGLDVVRVLRGEVPIDDVRQLTSRDRPLVGLVSLDRCASPHDVVCPDHHAGLGGEVNKAHVHAGVRQPSHRHGQLAWSVCHGEDDHLTLGVDGVAGRAQRSSGRAHIVRQYVDGAIEFGKAFDVDPRLAERLDNPG